MVSFLFVPPRIALARSGSCESAFRFVIDDEVAGDDRELFVYGGVSEDVDGRGGSLPVERASAAGTAGGGAGFVTVR